MYLCKSFMITLVIIVDWICYRMDEYALRLYLIACEVYHFALNLISSKVKKAIGIPGHGDV